VGQALKVNPHAPKVPCHRVIAADLRIGGFQGEAAGPTVQRKSQMLAKEGVRFENGRLADTRRVFKF
jgi:methylated-DNA-[protein]-cysteine S-methyltransferase